MEGAAESASVLLQTECESIAPTSLGVPTLSGFLWHRTNPKKKWERRFALCCHNFIVLFSEKDAANPSASKALAAVCFEDLGVAPLSPAPAEKEVAAFGAHAFQIAPTDGRTQSGKGGLFSSGSDSRIAHFVAESEEEAQAWMQALVIWKHSSLALDRIELADTRKRLANVLDELKQTAQKQLETRKEAKNNKAWAEAEHEKVVEAEAQLKTTRVTLAYTQQELAQTEKVKAEAIADIKKQRIVAAFSKTAREQLQSDLAEVKRELEETKAALEEARLHGGGNGGGGEGGGANGGSPTLRESPPADLKKRKQSGWDVLGGIVGGGGGGSGGGGASSTSPDGGGGGGGKKGTAIAWGESDDPLPKGKNHSDVDEETAINLLAQAQQVSPHFHDFSPKELVCLARTLAVIHFNHGDTIVYQGEPATFFAVVLEGAVAPVVNMVTKTESARGSGELVGEMALFNGGTRGASLVATKAGFLAVFQFEELARLRKAKDEMQRAIARKLNGQLAQAALAKELEASGEEISEFERQERLVELRLRQAEQHWETGGQNRGGGGGTGNDKNKGGETLMKRLQKMRKGSAHALAIMGAATQAMAGGGGKKAADSTEDEIDLDDEVLQMKPPPPPKGHGGTWKEGYLRKRAPEGRLAMNRMPRRLVVLNSVAMAYYEVKDGGQGGGGGGGGGFGGGGGGGGELDATGGVKLIKEEKGRIPLVAVRNVRLTRKEEGAQIEISVGTRTFYFLGKDDAESQAWRLAIDAARHHHHTRTDAMSKRLAERSKSRGVNMLAARLVHDSQLQHQRLSAAHSLETVGLRRISDGRSGVQQAAAAAAAANFRKISSGGDGDDGGLLFGGGGGPFNAEQELLSGWLHKQDHQQFSKQFKRRYWVLKAASLSYYRSESRDELLKTLPLLEVLEVIPAFEKKLSKYEGELHLKMKERTYKLLAETHEEMRKWMKALKKAKEAAQKHADGDDEGGGAGGAPAALAAAVEGAEELESSWTKDITNEQEVEEAVLRHVAAKFSHALSEAAEKAEAEAKAAAEAAGDDGAEAAADEHEKHVGALLGVAHEVMEDMLKFADDFRYSEPPRPELFNRCIKEFHSNLYANLAHLFRDVTSLRPMDALQLTCWLQEYRDRLALANAPPVSPPLGAALQDLVAAYAAQSQQTWEQCTRNLYEADVARLSGGDTGPSDELPGSMAPYDLLSMLNAPFATLKELQVPSLTNALVNVCAHVLTTYADLQRSYLHAIGDETLRSGGAAAAGWQLALPADGVVAAKAVCAVLNNCERTIDKLENLRDQIEHGDEDEDEESEDEADQAAGESEPPLPLGNEEARDAMQQAEEALHSVSPSGSAVLSSIALYRACVPGAEKAALGGPREILQLEPKELFVQAFGMLIGASRFMRQLVHHLVAERLDKFLVQLMVSHVIEGLLGGKANLFGEDAMSNGQELIKALEMLAGKLEGIDERKGAAAVAPLKRLFKLGTCGTAEFLGCFHELRQAHGEVSGQVAEALLTKRGVSKAELKELTSQANAAAGAGGPIGEGKDPTLWAPDEMAALVGAPFGTTVGRLSGGKGGLWAKAKFGAILVGKNKGGGGGGSPSGGGGGGPGKRGSVDGGPPSSRPRQMSGAL